MTEMIEDSGKILNPKSFINGKHVFIPPGNGHPAFPGSLWYICELTENENGKYRQKGIPKPWIPFNIDQYARCGIHDHCSYGNGLRLTGNKAYEKVIVQQPNPSLHAINPVRESSNRGMPIRKRLGMSVIIDNMMNLELLSTPPN